MLAFEPLPEHIRLTKDNIETNNLDNVFFSDKALSDSKDTKAFKTHASGWCADFADSSDMLGEKAFIAKAGGEAQNCIEIRRTTLDAYISELEQPLEISIIQLDVEGHEIEALEGARDTIRSNLPVIVLEDGPNTGPGNGFYSGFLKPLGYEYHPTKVGHPHGELFFGNHVLYIPAKHALKW